MRSAQRLEIQQTTSHGDAYNPAELHFQQEQRKIVLISDEISIMCDERSAVTRGRKDTAMH